MSKSVIALIIVTILLIISLAYIVINAIEQQRVIQLQAAFQQGFNQGQQSGFSAALTQLLLQTNNCQPAIINIQNSTRQLIDTDCLGR